MQPRCAIDQTIERVTIEGFAFPLGAYPVEPMTPVQGYRVEFEPADAGDVPGDPTEFVDEWPDRYIFDIVLSAERIESLFMQLVPLLPGRVYPILDFIGHDAFREIDPYIARNLVGTDWLLDAVRACGPFFFEDGMCGFGALSDDPFLHLFLDEHKILTIRCEPEMKERFEKALAAFDLKPLVESSRADAAAHEHRNVLWTPDDRPDLLSAEEIVEDLRDAWQLELNVDISRNLDDAGTDPRRPRTTTAAPHAVGRPAHDDPRPPRGCEPGSRGRHRAQYTPTGDRDGDQPGSIRNLPHRSIHHARRGGRDARLRGAARAEPGGAPDGRVQRAGLRDPDHRACERVDR